MKQTESPVTLDSIVFTRALNVFSPITLPSEEPMVSTCGSRNWFNKYTTETILIVMRPKYLLAASSQPARVCFIIAANFDVNRCALTSGCLETNKNWKWQTLSPIGKHRRFCLKNCDYSRLLQKQFCKKTTNIL